MRRIDCGSDCVGPDCEGCENFKPLSSDAVLDDGWRDARKEISEYDKHYLVYYDSGNMQVIFYWATSWEDLIKPMNNGDYIKAWRPLPATPAFT